MEARNGAKVHILNERWSPMKQIKKILQIILPLALAVLLFWWVYRDMDFSRLGKAFSGDVHYGWFIFSLFLSVLSMVLRGLRWHQLIEPVCPGGRKKVTILSIFVSYAANMLLPRAGEVARCGILKKADGLSFTKTLGTVITERVFDMICLLVIALATVLLQMGFFRNFFIQNPESLKKLIDMATSPVLWGGFVALILLFILLRKRIRRFGFYEKLHDFVLRLWEGMKSITTLKHPLLFIFYSVAIWGCYFLMFYIVKYFFSFDISLGVLAMLSGFVMGSFGVVAPVQGGIGAYHFMVIYTLMFYGISESNALIFALVAHGLQTVYTLVTGLIAYVWISSMEKRKLSLLPTDQD
jgi:glycosyltransferase 2 family protein